MNNADVGGNAGIGVSTGVGAAMGMGAGAASDPLRSLPDADQLDKTMSVRHAKPAASSGNANAGSQAGNVIPLTPTFDDDPLNKTMSVRHAPPAGAAQHGQQTGAFGNNRQAGSPQYGQQTGAQPNMQQPNARRQRVDSFTGPSQNRPGNATSQMAMQIANEKRIRESEGGKKGGKGLIIFAVAVLLILFLILGFVKPGFLKHDKDTDADVTDQAVTETDIKDETGKTEGSGKTEGTGKTDETGKTGETAENPDQYILDGIKDDIDTEADADVNADADPDTNADAKTDTDTNDTDKADDPWAKKRSDYFSSAGLKVTPQGDFTFKTMLVSMDEDTEEISLKANIETRENRDGVKDGFKEVIFECRFDLDVFDESANPYFWYTVFDRYTGTWLEFDDSVDTDDEGFVHISGGGAGKDFDVKTEFESDSDDRYGYTTTIVTCPEWYDGTVFQIGYNSVELDKEIADTKSRGRLLRIDEQPCFDTNGHEYLYFTESDK
ncbi:MAG: hypothetical protein K5886_07115 [Lachnospiraceae bacterium]|nr:hypothetical protein [Lachnospiraceae bacterium]